MKLKVCLAFFACSYYHQKQQFHNLLHIVSNSVVERASSIIGPQLMKNLPEVCTCFYVITWFQCSSNFDIKPNNFLLPCNGSIALILYFIEVLVERLRLATLSESINTT